MNLVKNNDSPINSSLKDIANVFARSEKERPLFFTLLHDFIREQVSINTQKAYITDLLQFSEWLSKRSSSSFLTLNYGLALEYRDYVRAFGGRKSQGKILEATNRTLHRKISSISAFYNFVSKRSLQLTNKQIPNPFSHIKLVSIDNSETVTEALTSSELQTLMNYLKNMNGSLKELRDKAIIMVALDVIIRSSALINLKGENFYSHGDRYKLSYIDKGEKEFDEILHPNTAKAIIDYLVKMKECGRELTDADPLFVPITKSGEIKPLSKNMPSLIVREIMKRAGIKIVVDFHTLKATVSSEITDKFGPHIAQRKAKHAKVDQIISYHGKRRSREVPTSDKLDYLNF